MSIYFGASIKLLIDYKKLHKQKSPAEHSPNLTWLYAITIVTIASHIIKFFPTIFYIISGEKVNYTVINILIFIMLSIIGVKAIRVDWFLLQRSIPNKPKPYSTYSMEESEITLLEEKLKELMEKQRLYLIPNLTLKDISDNLKISSHHLSYLLNTQFNQNFYEFINGYRLEAVKNELINPQKKHLSIFAIACDCGFNSQSTFNRTFKQKEGLSPSKFREKFAAKVNEE